MSADQPHTCTVQTGRNGSPFLAFEPCSGQRPSFTSSLFTLDLQPGVSLQEAHALADQINRHLRGVSTTVF